MSTTQRTTSLRKLRSALTSIPECLGQPAGVVVVTEADATPAPRLFNDRPRTGFPR